MDPLKIIRIVVVVIVGVPLTIVAAPFALLVALVVIVTAGQIAGDARANADLRPLVENQEMHAEIIRRGARWGGVR